jgi:predicted MFS family arabinose efflux permease
MSMSLFQVSHAVRQDHPDVHLDRVLRRVVLSGVALVLLLPLARASTDWLGWLPLWLVGMPAVAWWALHRFRLPARGAKSHWTARRRRSPQARRIRDRGVALPRAA